MSFFPTPVLVRLQELRLWQGSYDSMLNKSKDTTTNPSDFETINGLSGLDTTHDSNNSSPLSSPGKAKDVDWDKKTISPSKPFEQLLEEKLAEDSPPQIEMKPKRPFLKKGAGLTRYKLNERPESVKNLRKSIRSSDDSQQNKSKKCLSAPTKRKSCLKNPSANTRKEPETDLTPLKMPELTIKSKAKWHKVKENGNEKTAEESNDGSDDFKTPKNHFSSHIIGKINEFALRHFSQNSPQKKNSANVSENQGGNNIHGNDTIYEKASENELRIFEALEERAENSSFSSTNSSIVRLLSSTPNKIKMPLAKSPIPEERKVQAEEYRETFIDSEKERETLQRKLQEVNTKSDVLHDFLKSLKKLGSKSEHKRLSNESRESAKEKPFTPDTSFSDEEKWSSHTDTDTRSQSPLSYYTEYDTICKGDASVKVDIGVNTSPREETEFKCLKCDELRTKLEKLDKEIPNIQAEKAKVCDFAKDLERKRDHLHREIEKMRKKYEDELRELREKLASERKRFAKEKMYFDTYVKDSSSRGNRREVTELKRELTEVKELMKLKDTKNCSTQARLRNQIKQLEKENIEFKTHIEKLQKENAKLNVSQKFTRPSEVKMLHEINRNLTKLTQETLKNNLNKSESRTIALNTEDVKTSKVIENDTKKKDVPLPQLKKNQISWSQNKTSSDITSNDSSVACEHNMTAFSNLTLEKQYENVFGQLPSPGPNNNSLNESKKERTEKVFEDGSKEIKYSNGNSKTISPDGKLIIVKYYNGDVKETNIVENTLKYYYAENETWHTQFGDGSELLEYPSGQKEKKYKDGKKEVICVDGSRLTKMPDGSEEIVYPDRSKMIKNFAGDRILFLPNGQKEIHTKEHKRREYPDGTVKILYPDGTQETRYASGRVRIKDANGVLIMDSHNPVP